MYAQKLTTELTWISLCHDARADENYSDKITAAHSLQSCRRKIHFRQCSETSLLHAVLNVVTVCARYCWTQSLPVPVTVERSHCLCPLMSNAATACARYSWTQSLPPPVIFERSYFLAHYCWTQSLPVPVTVERIYFLAHYCWTQSLPVPVTVKSSHCLYPLLLNAVTAYGHYCWTQSLRVPVTVERSHCLYPLLHRYEQHLNSSALQVVPHRLHFRRVRKVSEMIVSFFVSVCLHKTTRHPLDGFLWNFMWGIF
jgi:hypothetical protein